MNFQSAKQNPFGNKNQVTAPYATEEQKKRKRGITTIDRFVLHLDIPHFSLTHWIRKPIRLHRHYRKQTSKQTKATDIT